MIKIAADSACDFTPLMIEKGVARIPFTLQPGDISYTDDNSLDIKAYAADLIAHPRGRKTAAPSPQKYYEAYKEGDAVFVVTVSKHLSSSHDSALAARNMYIEDFGEKFIYVIDSKSASVGETLIVHELIRLSEMGLDYNEIAERIEKFIKDSHIYFILESFNTIVDSGRMNGYVAKLASMLNIVPICTGEDGKMALLSHTRGRKKAYSKLAELMEATDDIDEKRTLAIAHVDCADEAESLSSYLTEKLGFKQHFICEGTGLVYTYADYHGLVIAF